MAEMQHEKVNVKKVPMQSASYLRNEERIKQDEAELAELIKQDKEAKGIVDEPDEESSEDQPSSEESEAEPVQAESNTKQEEKTEAKAQEQKY